VDAIFRLKFLGTIQIERYSKPVRGFRSRKALALLGYLAVQNQPVPREQLADLFWEDNPEATGRANLSWTLNKLASLLPGRLQADRHTVQFQRSDSYWLVNEDLLCFHGAPPVEQRCFSRPGRSAPQDLPGLMSPEDNRQDVCQFRITSGR